MPGVIVFDPEDETVGFSVGDDQAAGVYLDIENDALYLSDLTNILQWEGDENANMTGTWRSGKIKLPRPVNMGAAVVDAQSYGSVVFKLYAEIQGVSTLIDSVGVNDDEPFRLPGGYTSTVFEVELISSDRIVSVAVAETVFELAGEE